MAAVAVAAHGTAAAAGQMTARHDTSNRARDWLIAAVLFVGTFALFSRVLGRDFEFVNYDDPDYVTKNEFVQGGLNVAGVRWALQAGVASNWHPLTWMSHMLDWTMWGDNPRGHHATNVLLHALNAALAFLVFRRLTGAQWTSAVFAALFAWHPLRVESVAWVAERKDVLSAFFWFGTLGAYAVYAQARAKAWYAIALVTFALGLMAKPMLVTLPCVLLLLDVWPLRRIVWPGPGRYPKAVPPGTDSKTVRFVGRGVPAEPGLLVLEKLPFFALAVASSVITYRVQKAGGAVTEALPLAWRLENAAVAVVRYLGKFLWPADLAVLYPHPGHWPAEKVFGAVVMVVALTALACWQWRGRPWLGIGWLWFLGTLVPVIGVVQVGLQSMADRYTYLPMLGVQLALLWTLREQIVSAAARRAWTIAAAVLLSACATRTCHQLGVWRNSETLFSHTIAVTHDNYVAYDNRGLYRFQQQRVDEALADYRQAIAISPRYINANNNLGHALAELGRPAEALPFYRVAFEANPAHLEVRNNLANALSDLGQLDEAMQHYDYVLARAPNHANALNGSAVVLAMRGKPAEAKARLEQAVRIAPSYAGAHNNLGNVCSMLGQREEAVAHYRRANELKPDAHTQALLGFTLAQLGRREEAIRELEAALRLQPNHAQAKEWLRALQQNR